MIGLVAATRNGRRRAAHLAQAWEDATLYPGKPSEALRMAWADCDQIVVFLAAGAAVRLAAPLLADKRRDPGLVCVDDAARYAVALAGGHAGGANDLASRVADALGSEPIITTASESLGLQALDSFGRDLGFTVEEGSDLAGVGAILVSGETVRLVSESRWPMGPLPDNVVTKVEDDPDENACEGATARMIISDRLVDEPGPGCVVYRPPSLVVGVGCSRGALRDEILNLLRSTLRAAGLSEKSVASLASIDVKSDEPGLLEAAEALGVPIRFHRAGELSDIEVPNPSSVVESAVGTPSVAEASVIATGAALVVEKRKSENATAAVGRLPVRGKLRLVGLGPGTDALIPPMARDALARSEVVVGLEQYVERIRHLLRPGTSIVTLPLGDEIARCERALAEAREGGSAALVSSGDVGVYARGSPALELAGEEVDVEVVPGITAAQAAASLLGSPLGHDHCSISLSDLLTPWEIIERRVRAAAMGDFIVSLYNPRSRGRDWQLGKVRSMLLEHRPPDTPVGIVKDAYREGAEVSITTLSDLRPEDVDMLTVVVVGSSRTRLIAGRMVTPRGYLD